MAALRDEHGSPGSLVAFRSEVVIVFFGYTLCPEVCPSTLARFADVMCRSGDDAGRARLFVRDVAPNEAVVSDIRRLLAGA